jgi:hypothetical protein
MLEERNGCKAHSPEFLDVRGPRNRVGSGGGYRNILIERRHRVFEAARKPERAKCEDPFGVDDMVQSLPDTPFFRRVPVERLVFRDPRKNTRDSSSWL